MGKLENTDFTALVSNIGYAIEAAGVLVIVIGVLLATVAMLKALLAGNKADLYQNYRRSLARSMMLGLEFLVAGDIVRTVIVASTLSDVLSLGLIVIIRTILVFTLHLESEGRWPWQAAEQNA